MKSLQPILWRQRPKFSLKRRWTFTGLAMLLTLLLLTTLTTVRRAWGQAATAPAASAPAATTPAAAQPALPDWFNGIPANPTGAPDSSSGKSTYGHWLTPSATPNADGSPGGDVPSKMSTSDLYDAIAHNEYAINIVWTLIEGFLVMFMQLGFAMVETGLCRAKNSGHTFAMNMMIYPLGCLGFYVYGFALGWGNWWNGPAAPAGMRRWGPA